jgi:hypothetical protein
MSDPQKNDANSGTFVPCYNKKNWKEDSWCQEDCIQRVLDNPETCDWHCVDPDMARQTTTNTGWACMSSGKYSRCTNSCGCRGSPGDSAWCCSAESSDVCWDNKCYASCAVTLPPSEPTTLPTRYPTTRSPTQYPTRIPTPFPTLPTFNPTYTRSPNYILLRRNSACVGTDQNLGVVTLDQCWEGCQNMTNLFIFGHIGTPKSSICRCELGEKIDALNCRKSMVNNNFDLYRILERPLPTSVPSILTLRPSVSPTSVPSILTLRPSVSPTFESSTPSQSFMPSYHPTNCMDCPQITCPKVQAPPCCLILYIIASLFGASVLAYSCWFVGKKWRRHRRHSVSARTTAAIAMVNFRHAMENVDLSQNDSMRIGIDISGN